MVRFRGRIKYSDLNVIPGSTKYDPGTRLTRQNQFVVGLFISDRFGDLYMAHDKPSSVCMHFILRWLVLLLKLRAGKMQMCSYIFKARFTNSQNLFCR